MVEDKPKSRETKQLKLEELKDISRNFTQELRNAQNGKKTSLAFIIHELSPSPIVEHGETFESLVIGGTTVRSALVENNPDVLTILTKDAGTKLAINNGESLLAFISSSLPDDVNVLALNFAQALKPTFKEEKLDGILLTVAKEGIFGDLIGKQIGKEIEDYVLAKRNKKIKVAVANDTVCLLTSGLTRFPGEKLAGGIVGTGLNFAFFLEKNKLVNLESGSFDKFPQTETGKIVDQESSQPGSDIFEKETAGAYLYRHFNLILKENGINYPNITSTEELDKISRSNIPNVSEVAQNLIKRSAELVACQIAGIVNLKKINTTFVMEGSLFWKGNNYKETVAKTVKILEPKYKVDFVEIENSAILGAAKLVS